MTKRGQFFLSPSVAVTEYRIDRDHGARQALAALPKRGSTGLYAPSELTDLIANSKQTPLAPPSCRTASGGVLTIPTRLLSQGIVYLDAVEASMPAEVAGLAFAADKTTLSWNSAASAAGPSTVHDVVRGALDQLPVGSGSSEVCIASGVAAATTADATVPAMGGGLWYLARGRNACGAGSYGRQSGGTERTSAACP